MLVTAAGCDGRAIGISHVEAAVYLSVGTRSFKLLHMDIEIVWGGSFWGQLASSFATKTVLQKKPRRGP